jgi:transcriptional antiterminator RfaH
MPALPLEQFVFPDDLLMSDAWPGEESASWWVLHTRPRAEKSLARRLFAQQVPFFLPLYERRRTAQASSYHPLFAGYLFILGDWQQRLRALQTNLVANCLNVADPARLQRELAGIHRLMRSGAALAPEARIRPGMLVEIHHGPLAGMEGKVIRRGRQLRFVVEIDFLQRGASAEVEGWMLAPHERELRPARAAV